MNCLNMKIKQSAWILFIFLAIGSRVHAQYDFQEYSDTISLYNEEDLLGFDLLDSLSNTYKIFVAGENHTYLESNTRLWVNTIKYLHKNANVRNVIVEYGYASTWMVNEYIQTGDTNIYNTLKRYAFKEYAAAYKALKDFNDSLDADNKISLVGIDLERGVYSAVKVLSMLLPDEKKVAHDSIDLHIESLRGYIKYQDKVLYKEKEEETEDLEDVTDFRVRMFKYEGTYSLVGTMEFLMDNFKLHKDQYKAYLGDSFDFFERIVDDLWDVRRWKEFEENNAVQDYVYREKYMYDRFVEEYALRKGNFYGQFGRCHSSKQEVDKNSCNWYGFKSFANRLKNSRHIDLTGKVLSMGILYEDDDYDADEWSEMEDHIDSLFNLMPTNSVKLYNLPQDTVLSEYFVDAFDYFILNTYSPSKDHPYSNSYDDYDYSYTSTRMKIAVGFGEFDYDFESFNELFSGINGLESGFGLSESTTLYFTTASEYVPRLVSFTLFQLFKKRSFDGDPNRSFKFKGYSLNNGTMFNFTPNLDAIDFMLGGSFGYSRLTFDITENNLSTPAGGLNSGFMGDNNHIRYYNPAITLAGVGALELNLSPFTLGGLVGYNYDLSKKNWRNKSGLVGNSPKTAFTGIFATTYIGFKFEF
ncbi:MAG: hypothetical protein ACI8ZN_000574 [Bacteroidia bacterium]|jgi:hypothetical protein